MPTKSHHRSRSSVDRVFDLLADLQETQISLLLDDFNHTTASNVPVSDAIALFDPNTNKRKARRSVGRSSSPVRTLQAELERRNSRRISSAPEPVARPRSALPPPPAQQPAVPETPSTPENTRVDRAERPTLTLSPSKPLTIFSPDTYDRPSSATSERRSEFRARSYKRISRPMLLSPTATAELHELLLAYFQESPTSASSSATPSPVTPKTIPSFSFSHFQPETDGPGLDLLEPSPARLPVPYFSSRRMVKQASMESMNSIFEVLESQ